MRKKRPVFINLLQIRFPVTAVTSIAHRVSGVILFLVTPLLIYLLDYSLKGPSHYEEVRQWVTSPLFRTFLVLGVWALAHHVLAGFRFLLLDLDIGVRREVARASAWLVNITAFIGLAWALGAIW